MNDAAAEKIIIFNGITRSLSFSMHQNRPVPVYSIVRKLCFYLIATVLLTGSSHPVLGQKYLNNWFFGGYAAIDFNATPPAKIFNSAMYTDEGSASISDPVTGELLFYTNGDTVWNRNHQKMPNGVGLGGHRSTTQSALIVPDPGNPQRYYVFSIYAQANEFIDFCCGSGGLNLNTIDMTLDGGLGDVVVKNQLVLTPTTEKLVAVKQCNGKDYWVVTHEFHSKKFYAFPLTAAGLGTPVISEVGMEHDEVGSGSAWETIGYMRISPDGKKLALAANQQLNQVELFNFDDVTGQVGPLIISDGNYPNLCGQTGPYGVCFSPDASKLYVSTTIGGCFSSITEFNYVYQYDLSSGDSATIIASRTELHSANQNGTKFGALQIGPDGKIYVAKVGSIELDVIQNPNAAGVACNYAVNAFLLNVPGSDNSSKYGLPNSVESWLAPHEQFTLSFEGCVQTDTLLFLDTIVNQPFTVEWNFGDPASGANNVSSLQHAYHDFSTNEVYNVTLTIFLPCDTIVVTKPFNTTGSGLLNAGSDTTICNGESVMLSANGSAEFTWTPADGLSCTDCAQPLASPTATTTYVLANACNITDTVVVTVLAGTSLITSGDVTTCGNAPVQLSASGATVYAWFPADGLSATNIPNPIANVSGNATYTVIGSLNNCRPDTQTVSISISTAPDVDAGADTTITEGESIQLTATSFANNFSWLPSESLLNPNTAQPTASPITTTWYRVTVTDDNGCTASDSVLVLVETNDAILILPNAFSPNGDGINDRFVYFARNVKDIHYQIFNRWGQLVFETNAMNVFWDGTYKNKMQGNAVFVYSITATSFSGEQTNFSGNVTLLQ